MVLDPRYGIGQAQINGVTAGVEVDIAAWAANLIKSLRQYEASNVCYGDQGIIGRWNIISRWRRRKNIVLVALGYESTV